MKLLVANWKLNLPDLNGWKKFSSPKGVGVAICPPFPYLRDVKKIIKRGVGLGAQDVFWQERGPFTGEVSPSMLKKLGVEYVIVGHSERRALGETNDMINKKVRAATAAGLKMILCVGEPKEIRKRGLSAAKKFVANQLKKDLRGIENWKLGIGNLAIAYEPIWAVGTGVPDKPEDSDEMAKFIKSTFPARLEAGRHIPHSTFKALYGGSVTSKNAQEFFAQENIDGALVGGASLDPEEFRKIAEAAALVAK